MWAVPTCMPTLTQLMPGAALDTVASAGPVRAALDEGALLSYLVHAAPHVLPASPLLSVRQFSHGQSNPTYLVTASSHTHSLRKSFVLRKKPAGTILASAHAVEREFQVISALHATSGGAVPVPKPLLLCNDSSILGTPFYIMEFAQGHIYLVRIHYNEAPSRGILASWC